MLSPSLHTRTIYVKLLFLLSKNLKKKKKKLLLLINMKATLLQRDKLKQDKNLFLLQVNFSFKIQAARRAEN